MPSAQPLERPLLSLIGAGRAGSALGRALRARGWKFHQVFSRDLRKASRLAAELGAEPVADLAQLSPDAGLFLLAVPDDAIGLVAAALPEPAVQGGAVVLHTSGSAALSALGDLPMRGVFYPLQSFSHSTEPDWSTIPLVLEAGSAAVARLQERMADDLGGPVFHLDSEARTWLHLAAVIANNFANHCFAMASEILASRHLPAALLGPLIRETAHRAADSPDPAAEQTGPALRGDRRTLERHLQLLAEDPGWAALYRDLSASITRLEQRRSERGQQPGTGQNTAS